MNDQRDSQPTPVPDGDVLPATSPALGLVSEDLMDRCAVAIMYPGDSVLLLCPTDPGDTPAIKMLDHLHEGFPGVTFHIAGGIAGALIAPGPAVVAGGALLTPDHVGVQLHPETAPAPRASALTDGVPR